MARRFSSIAVGFLITCQFACGGGSLTPSPASNSSGRPSANISISPGSAPVGSPDLVLTVSGSQNFTFTSTANRFSQVVWSQGDVDTSLLTTFVSSSQLTAILPASLLTKDVSATLRVEIRDVREEAPIAKSSPIHFQVTSTTTPTTVPTPSISSISPSTVPPGSPDMTITINGSNFGHYGPFTWSTAFLTTNGNLHDTGKTLKTNIISSSQLTAAMPAELLQSPHSVHIVVMNGDVMGMSDGYFGYPMSNSVTFTVAP